MNIVCDLHMHSALSPCALEEMTPNNMVNMALLQELTAIAVTDHNSCRNAAAVMEVAQGTGLVVVPGLEVQTREEVHVVTLFQSLDDALAMQEEVYAALPDMKAPAKIRNKQLLMDAEDEVVGYEEGSHADHYTYDGKRNHYSLKGNAGCLYCQQLIILSKGS